jgi:HipA-like protein
MKRGIVYYRDIVAGELIKDDEGYLFRYDSAYFVDPAMPDVSATLPK